MLSTVYINGRSHRLQLTDVIGQGGEAVVYRHVPGEVVKVFIDPADPSLRNEPEAQKAARDRLAEHQRKLPAFPTGLPDHVVAPRALAFDRQAGGRIVGYTMQHLAQLEVLLSYGERKFCQQSGIEPNQTVQIFQNLRSLVGEVHAAKVVIGDFNDLNVLVAPDGQAYLIDADSMQFGPFLCNTFTTRFADPLHYAADKLQLVKPHTQLTDWYAFSAMLFRSLLFVHPYGGVHRPKTGKQFAETARILNRVSVFSPDVIYPGAALPLTVLPDDLLEYFSQVFVQDKRGAFPADLLETLRWTNCLSCGVTHARQTCPVCAAAVPGAIKQVITVRGTVTATRQFQTHGQILFATTQGGELRYVYHESGAYKREGEFTLLAGNLDRELRVRIWNDKTVLAKQTSLIVLDQSGTQARHTTQVVGRLPVFDANGEHLYWIDGEQLVRDAPLGTATIGDVLPNRTLIWVGDHFGFGFFRAGALTRGFVFNARRQGLNDNVPLPPMRGNLIDATCVFANHHAWFLMTIAEGKDIKNHCYVINDTAELLAHAEAVQGDGTWLGEGIRGRFARGTQLFAATETGIVRVGLDGSRVRVQQEYPDTKSFVSADTQLLPSREGIIAVSAHEIVLLQIR